MLLCWGCEGASRVRDLIPVVSKSWVVTCTQNMLSMEHPLPSPTPSGTEQSGNSSLPVLQRVCKTSKVCPLTSLEHQAHLGWMRRHSSQDVALPLVHRLRPSARENNREQGGLNCTAKQCSRGFWDILNIKHTVSSDKSNGYPRSLKGRRRHKSLFTCKEVLLSFPFLRKMKRTETCVGGLRTFEILLRYFFFLLFSVISG